MSKSNFNLQNFTSAILSGEGLARNNRFEVLIPYPRGLNSTTASSNIVSLYVEQTSIPLLNIFAKAFKIFGPTYQRPITSEYGGEGLSMTFHIDKNMDIRRFFEDWMHIIIDPYTYTVGYAEDYNTNITIRQLDEQENITYEVELIDAFPRNINLMDLNNGASNQTHRLNVLFAYRYWKRKDTSRNQIVDVPRSITTPQVPRVDNRVSNKQSSSRNTGVRLYGISNDRSLEESYNIGAGAGGASG